MYKLFALAFLLIFLSGCYEVVQELRLDKKVRVDKLYDYPVNFSTETFKTFSFISNNNYEYTLEYKSIGKIIIDRLTKLGFVYSEDNPDFKVSYVYGNAANQSYSFNSSSQLSFQENYSYSMMSSNNFILNINFYKDSTKLFEAYSYIKLDSYSIKNENYTNIHDYINCLVNSIFYNNKTTSYVDSIATESFIVLCDKDNRYQNY